MTQQSTLPVKLNGLVTCCFSEWQDLVLVGRRVPKGKRCTLRWEVDQHGHMVVLPHTFQRAQRLRIGDVASSSILGEAGLDQRAGVSGNLIRIQGDTINHLSTGSALQLSDISAATTDNDGPAHRNDANIQERTIEQPNGQSQTSPV